MEFLTPDFVVNLLDGGWRGILTLLVLRWVYFGWKAKKNGNGNGRPRRRMTDTLPGNPGHSPHEVIAARIESIEHRLKEQEERTFKLGQSIARIQGQITK